MRKIEPPKKSVIILAKRCSDDLQKQNLNLSTKLKQADVIRRLRQDELEYQRLASQGDLHVITQDSLTSFCISAESMKTAYKMMSSGKKSAKEIYDQIKIAPDKQICPYCNQRGIVHLDHFLPKSKYPAFSITPINLVPICYECNSGAGKGSKYPQNDRVQFGHPYFDNFDDEVWLKASIDNDNEKTTITYFAYHPATWIEVKFEKIKYHFQNLKLSDLYASNAACELQNRKTTLNKYFNAGGADELMAYLGQEAIDRRESEKNSWRSALYEALAESSWFCSHGILNL